MADPAAEPQAKSAFAFFQQLDSAGGGSGAGARPPRRQSGGPVAKEVGSVSQAAATPGTSHPDPNSDQGQDADAPPVPPWAELRRAGQQRTEGRAADRTPPGATAGSGQDDGRPEWMRVKLSQRALAPPDAASRSPGSALLPSLVPGVPGNGGAETQGMDPSAAAALSQGADDALPGSGSAPVHSNGGLVVGSGTEEPAAEQHLAAPTAPVHAEPAPGIGRQADAAGQRGAAAPKEAHGSARSAALGAAAAAEPDLARDPAPAAASLAAAAAEPVARDGAAVIAHSATAAAEPDLARGLAAAAAPSTAAGQLAGSGAAPAQDPPGGVAEASPIQGALAASAASTDAPAEPARADAPAALDASALPQNQIPELPAQQAPQEGLTGAATSSSPEHENVGPDLPAHIVEPSQHAVQGAAAQQAPGGALSSAGGTASRGSPSPEAGPAAEAGALAQPSKAEAPAQQAPREELGSAGAAAASGVPDPRADPMSGGHSWRPGPEEAKGTDSLAQHAPATGDTAISAAPPQEAASSAQQADAQDDDHSFEGAGGGGAVGAPAGDDDDDDGFADFEEAEAEPDFGPPTSSAAVGAPGAGAEPAAPQPAAPAAAAAGMPRTGGGSSTSAAPPSDPVDLLGVSEPDFLAAVRELMRPLQPSYASTSQHAGALVSLEARWAAAGHAGGSRGGDPAARPAAEGARAALAIVGPFGPARSTWPSAGGAQLQPVAAAAPAAAPAPAASEPAEAPALPQASAPSQARAPSGPAAPGAAAEAGWPGGSVQAVGSVSSSNEAGLQPTSRQATAQASRSGGEAAVRADSGMALREPSEHLQASASSPPRAGSTTADGLTSVEAGGWAGFGWGEEAGVGGACGDGDEALPHAEAGPGSAGDGSARSPAVGAAAGSAGQTSAAESTPLSTAASAAADAAPRDALKWPAFGAEFNAQSGGAPAAAPAAVDSGIGFATEVWIGAEFDAPSGGAPAALSPLQPSEAGPRPAGPMGSVPVAEDAAGSDAASREGLGVDVPAEEFVPWHGHAAAAGGACSRMSSDSVAAGELASALASGKASSQRLNEGARHVHEPFGWGADGDPLAALFPTTGLPSEPAALDRQSSWGSFGGAGSPGACGAGPPADAWQVEGGPPADAWHVQGGPPADARQVDGVSTEASTGAAGLSEGAGLQSMGSADSHLGARPNVVGEPLGGAPGDPGSPGVMGTGRHPDASLLDGGSCDACWEVSRDAREAGGRRTLGNGNAGAVYAHLPTSQAVGPEAPAAAGGAWGSAEGWGGEALAPGDGEVVVHDASDQQPALSVGAVSTAERAVGGAAATGFRVSGRQPPQGLMLRGAGSSNGGCHPAACAKDEGLAIPDLTFMLSDALDERWVVGGG